MKVELADWADRLVDWVCLADSLVGPAAVAYMLADQAEVAGMKG